MRLSVILPCYNGAATIAVQLEALTFQQWPGGWEVIVVNNGSTDESMAIVERYRHRLPDLQIVQAHVPGTLRKGVPHSYNVGIAAASGDAFVFCEADDEVAPGWLEAMGRALQAHPFVVARLEHRKLNAEWLHPVEGNGYQYDGIMRRKRAPYLESASAAGFGLQRSIYQELGPLSTEFPIVHDTEYCWRAQLAGYSLHFVPEAVIHYRERSDLRSRYLQGRSWGYDTERLRRHYGVPPKRFQFARKLVWIARLVPRGARALALGGPRARQWVADWVWNLGHAIGEARVWRPHLDVPLRLPSGTVSDKGN